jgi:hypothetical protein
MTRRRLPLAVAVLLATGAAACGSVAGEDQSIVVIHVIIDPGVPELHQIRVAAHLPSGGIDADLYFPPTPGGPIASGATLALLIPTSRTGLLDLVLYGFDAGHTMVARGNGQTTINVGKQVDTTITLMACSGGC